MDQTTILIILGVVAVGVAAYFLFFNKSSAPAGTPATEFNVKLSQFSSSKQDDLNQFANALASVSVTYNTVQSNFALTQIPSGSDFMGFVLTSADSSKKVYFTYYEFGNLCALNSANAVLTIPSRTLANGAITNNASSGYRVKVVASVASFSVIIDTVQTAVTRGLVNGSNNISLDAPYTGSGSGGSGSGSGSGSGGSGSGGSGSGSGSGSSPFSVTLAQLPSPVGAQISGYVSSLQSISISYNSATVAFTGSQITSGSDSIGVLLASDDGMVNVYLTYYEFFNLMMSNPSAILTIPARTVSGGAVTDSALTGYTVQSTGFGFVINSVDHAVLRSLVDGQNNIPLDTLLYVF